MRKDAVAAAVSAAAVAAVGFCTSAHGALVISQIYTDGGFDSNAAYKNDYVMLYNSGSSAVSLNNVDLEYGSSSGAVGANSFEFFPLPTSASLGSSVYYLIEMGGSSNGFGAALPTPDLNDSNTAIFTAPSFNSAKFALVLGNASVGNTPTTVTQVLDYVTYRGTGATFNSASGWPLYANNTLTLPYGLNAGTSYANNGTPVGDAKALVRIGYTGDNSQDFAIQNPDPIASPEPASIGLMATIGTMMIARRRRR
jgi:hypothetical protein